MHSTGEIVIATDQHTGSVVHSTHPEFPLGYRYDDANHLIDFEGGEWELVPLPISIEFHP